MKTFARYILLLIILLLPIVGTMADNRIWRSLTMSEGLSDLVVNALYKDTRGYVWIGTGNSLERFDGVHIHSYRITGTNEKLKRVNVITELPGGEIWMGNGTGLWRVNLSQDMLEPMAQDVINDAVYSLLADGKDTFYIGTKKGLFIYRQGHVEQVLLDKNLFSTTNEVRALALDDKAGCLWMATSKGLGVMRLKDKSVTFYHNEAAGKHFCSFNCMTRMGDTLYLGTMEQGIVTFDTRQKRFAPYIDVDCNVISTLSTDGKHLLYVGTDGAGVQIVDVEKRQVVRRLRHVAGSDEGIRSNSVYSFLADADGLYWVGFYQQGLDYSLFQNRLFDVYSYPPYFNTKDMPVRALSVKAGEKLIGSRDGLFYIDELRNRFAEFKTPALRSSMIFSIEPYGGEYYVGTYGGGMYIFNPERMELRDFESTTVIPFVNGHIFCMEQDAHGELWIGTSAGLFRYRGGKRVAHYTSANSQLPEGNVYEIFFDSTRKGWICTENGLCLWDPSAKKLRTDVFPEGFIHREKIRVVYEDKAHQLFFFPDKGVPFFSDLAMNSFHRLLPGTPLDGHDGLCIVEDADGWLWIGTSNGLFHYDKQGHCMPYSFVDGLPGGIFTLCKPVREGRDHYWFGNSKGLIHLDMKRLKAHRRKHYAVQVSDIHRLGDQSVRLVFSDFTYTEPAYMAFEYRLDGVDDHWKAVTGVSEATYYDLSAGHYTFKVRRMGQPLTESSYDFQIAYRFNGWMVATVVSLFTLIGMMMYYRWRRKLRYRRKLAVQRQAELEVRHQQQASADSSHSHKGHATASPDEKYRTLNLSKEDGKHLYHKLETVMRREKPYKNPELKLSDLADAIGTSPHTLSYLFSQHIQVSYYDYVNNYRIAEFKALVKNGEYSKYTLGALAELCGFSSRASFFRYFKKATGITPSEYIKQQG